VGSFRRAIRLLEIGEEGEPLQLRVHSSGEILESSFDPSEGVHAIGSVRGRIDPTTLLIDPLPPADLSALSDEEAVTLHSDAILLRIEGNRLSWIAPDIAGTRDVFIASVGDTEWWLDDNFESMVLRLGAVRRNASAERFFVSHGYFCDGETFFKDVSRIRTGMRLCFHERLAPNEENLFMLCRPSRWASRLNYRGFREALDSVFDAEKIDDQDAVLLSGGCDSGIIAGVAALRFGRRPTAFTHSYVQSMDNNDVDARRSARVAEFMGLPHQLVPVDFDALNIADLDQFVHAMPLAAHFSLNFLKTVSAATDNGARRVWCGQNADSVYNLGPTSRLGKGAGKGDIIKRFFLSREFHRTLPDIQDGSLLNPLFRWVGHAGTHMARYRYRRPFYLPENFNELLHSFREADHYLALKKDGAASQPPCDPPINTCAAREKLFEEKLASFLVGRDARCVMRAAGLKRMSAVLPFSAPSLLMFFRSLEQSFCDTLLPKRYMFKYYRELVGRKAYGRLYQHKVESKAQKTDDWQRWVLKNTEIGKALVQGAEPSARALGISPDFLKLQLPVSLFWYDRVYQSARQQGVTILPDGCNRSSAPA